MNEKKWNSTTNNTYVSDEMVRTSEKKVEETKLCAAAFPGYILHINDWWWGKTFTIVHEKGIGTVELQLDNSYPSVAFIKGLSVYPDNRHYGIGTEMMSICERIAKHEGYKFLQLTALHTGSWLPEWYRRLGYSVFMKDEHEYTMMKCIDLDEEWERIYKEADEVWFKNGYRKGREEALADLPTWKMFSNSYYSERAQLSEHEGDVRLECGRRWISVKELDKLPKED